MRKNTVVRDPIGSTRNSLTRRDRRSLRRHILEVANDGLKMDTQKIVGELTYAQYKVVFFLFFLSISNILGIKSHCSLAFSFYLEYNPKLSEATQTTRVAYVKFMAHAMRRESNADADTETKEVDMNKVRKSILRTASKASAV